ncbi:hypothetical protein ABE444_10850 [Brevundimonas pondensis]|uniref:hypothetical protein n=1 Tax=Brevundimonas pondensis TaxID=2774189 RepID=UPI0032083039
MSIIARIWRAAFAVGNLRLWAIILGAFPLTAFAGWLVWLVRYGWPVDRAEQQLTILGGALFGALALIAIIVVALATVKVRATTPAGSLEIDGDE